MAYCTDWCQTQTDRNYHDREWGRPLRNDRKQFEFLMLEVMQCGLSWRIVLNKREIFRRCFDGFDFTRIAAYTPADITRILRTPGMLRSPRKIKAVIQNAQAFMAVRKKHGTFSRFLWAYSGGKTIVYAGHARGYVPPANALSVQISRDLKALGFTFLGPVTVYSHLQACGMINDHSADCPCFGQINRRYPTVKKPRADEM